MLNCSFRSFDFNGYCYVVPTVALTEIFYCLQFFFDFPVVIIVRLSFDFPVVFIVRLSFSSAEEVFSSSSSELCLFVS